MVNIMNMRFFFTAAHSTKGNSILSCETLQPKLLLRLCVCCWRSDFKDVQ